MTVLSNSFWAIKFIFSISKVHSILIVLTTFYRSLSPIVVSFIAAQIIDLLLLSNISVEEKTTLATQNVLVLFVILAFGNIAGQINSYSRSGIARYLRLIGFERIYEKAAQLTLEQLEDPEINNLMKRANDNLRSTLDLFRSLIGIISNIVTMIADALIIISFLPIYVLGYVVFSVVYFIPIRYFIKKDFKYNKDWTEPVRKAMQTAAQLSDATYIKEIRVNESYQYFNFFFKGIKNNYLGGQDIIRMKWSITEFIVGLPLLVVHFFGYMTNVLSFIQGLISLGTMTFRFSSLARFNSGVSGIVEEFNYVSEFSLQITECRLFLSLKPDEEKDSITLVTEKAPSLEINNLTFKYKNAKTDVIKNLNLKIKSGEKIAIVGHNGAGKTTLIKLISKIYDVVDGEILINGENLNKIESTSYFKNLGVLFQDFVNYTQLSIRDNISLETSEEQNSDRVVEAAKLADAHEFIEVLPNKYDTLPSERYNGGVRLSGGQNQKLALARFFYKDAPLLIFDEPTAAIDAVSEYKIFNNIYDFFKDKTVIIISHRFSTVRNADRIVVMKDGEIAEEGTHDELMKLNKLYAESYNLQAGEYNKA